MLNGINIKYCQKFKYSLKANSRVCFFHIAITTQRIAVSWSPDHAIKQDQAKMSIL